MRGIQSASEARTPFAVDPRDWRQEPFRAAPLMGRPVPVDGQRDRGQPLTAADSRSGRRMRWTASSS